MLADFNYRFERPHVGDYRFQIATSQEDRWRAQLIASETTLRFFVWGADPGSFQPRHLSDIRKAVEAVNSFVVFGSFSLDNTKNAVVYRDALQLFACPDVDDVAALLHRSSFILKVWRSAFDLIRLNGANGESAVKFSVLMNGAADDEAALTDEDRRRLWCVANGSGPSPFDQASRGKPKLRLVKA